MSNLPASDMSQVYNHSLVLSSGPSVRFPLLILNDRRNNNEPYTLEVNLPQAAQHDTQLISLWLKERSPKTITAYLRDLARFYHFLEARIVQEIAEGKPERTTALANVTLDDLYAFLDSLADLKQKSRVRTMSAIKSLLGFGATTRYLTFNVGAPVKLRRPEKKIAERIVSEQKAHLIIENAREHPRNYAILNLLYYGGLRAEELCNLKWRNLQERENSGQVTVFGKRDKTRSVLLDSETWGILQALRPEDASEDDYVFQSRQAAASKGRVKKESNRLAESRIHRIVKDAALAAGVAVYADKDGDKESRFSPHWFRHSHATHAQNRGVPAAVIQATLGHENIETTMQYVHVMPNASSSTALRH